MSSRAGKMQVDRHPRSPPVHSTGRLLRRAMTKRFWFDLHAEIRDDNVFNGAAALAFYLTLAIFPAMIILLAIVPYLPVEDVDEVILDLLQQALPQEAATLVEGIVTEVARERRGSHLTFGLVATLWAATTGMVAIMRQLNVTYDVEEGRGFVRARLTALVLSMVFATLLIGASLLVIMSDAVEGWLSRQVGQSGVLAIMFGALHWALVLSGMLTGFALIYHYAPNLQRRFRPVTPGSCLGAVVLIGASLGFSVYVRNFGGYEASYGSIGAVIVLMLWLYAAGLAILLGSELDALLERYRRDERDALRRPEEPSRGHPS